MLQRFLVGASYPWRGLAFIRQHRLWPYCLGIIVTNVLAFAAIIASAVLLLQPLTNAIAATAFVQAHPSVMVVLWALIGVLLIVSSALAVALLARAIASLFLDALSERVETIVTGRPPEPMTLARVVRTVGIAIADIVWSVLLALVVYLGLLVLGVVPVVGTIVSGVLAYAFAALMIAQELLGLPQARQFRSYGARWRFAMSHRGHALGLGAMTFLLLLVPGLGFIALSISAAGATLLYAQLESRIK